jgi:ATP-dependent DNA ligase
MMQESALPRQIARFIYPMECLPVPKIPEGPLWTYEIKLDGHRILPVRTRGSVVLYSRRGNDLTSRCAAAAGRSIHFFS